MLLYIVKRILGILPVLVGISFVAFAIIALFPGDFYTLTEVGYVMSGMSRGDAVAAARALRAAAGMDKPWIVQYWLWFTGIITKGDFGINWSFVLRPENGLAWTLIIAGSSMFWGWLLGLPAGILAGTKKNTWIDRVLTGTAYIGFSFPSYVWGTLFFVFMFTCVNTHIRGPGIWGLVGYELVGKPLSWYKVGSHILHLIPAWIIVGAPIYATVLRHMRSSMAEAMSAPYITVVRAKGLGERTIVYKHALRNAINPLISIFGITLPRMITSMILLAPILGMPTFGQFLLDCVLWNQTRSLLGGLLVYTGLLLVGNLIADLLLVVIDPRIRYD